jgi:protein-tyrosine phosphatase
VDADQIAPGLWLGSAPITWLGGAGRLSSAFDTIVLMAKELPAPNYPGVRVISAPIDDHRLTGEEISIVEQAADSVVAELKKGRRVLVACHMGVNRSALVVAMVLIQAGMTPQAAIERIRRLRHTRIAPLSNESFVEYLLYYGSPIKQGAA